MLPQFRRIVPECRRKCGKSMGAVDIHPVDAPETNLDQGSEMESQLDQQQVEPQCRQDYVTLTTNDPLATHSSGYNSSNRSEICDWDCCQTTTKREDSGSNQGSVGSESSVRVRLGCCADWTWNRGRKFQMIQMIVLPFIPIVALITQNIVSLYGVLEYQQDVADIDKQVMFLTVTLPYH
ncbi:unnamed protein product [Allacma fusca]|uniref:Uncharacterized protein n=1 Tax=Allacma fusca TaxID=39272 RepID=A0A8J2LDB2_9HEXA|nr:unnamed protein product [Allacma fusca]